MNLYALSYIFIYRDYNINKVFNQIFNRIFFHKKSFIFMSKCSLNLYIIMNSYWFLKY